jgi:glycosyltransferase 2 family protein
LPKPWLNLPDAEAGGLPVAKTGSLPDAESGRRKVVFAARLLLTAATLAAVAYFAFQGKDLVHGGQWAWDWKWLAAALAVMPLVVAGRAWKWQLLIAPLDRSITFVQALTSYLGSLPLGLVTPGRVGEFSRCLFLPQASVHTLAGAGRVFLDNWTDFLAVLLWSIVGWKELWGGAGVWLGILLALVFLPMGQWLRVLRRLVGALPAFWGLREGLQKGLPAPEHSRTRDLAAALLAGTALYGLEWLQLDFLLRFLGAVPPGFLQLGGLMALVTLANSVQVTLGGLGVREGLAVYLLALAGVDFGVSLVATFGLFSLDLLLPSLVGLGMRPHGMASGVSAKQ